LHLAFFSASPRKLPKPHAIRPKLSPVKYPSAFNSTYFSNAYQCCTPPGDGKFGYYYRRNSYHTSSGYYSHFGSPNRSEIESSQMQDIVDGFNQKRKVSREVLFLQQQVYQNDDWPKSEDEGYEFQEDLEGYCREECHQCPHQFTISLGYHCMDTREVTTMLPGPFHFPGKGTPWELPTGPTGVRAKGRFPGGETSPRASGIGANPPLGSPHPKSLHSSLGGFYPGNRNSPNFRTGKFGGGPIGPHPGGFPRGKGGGKNPWKTRGFPPPIKTPGAEGNIPPGRFPPQRQIGGPPQSGGGKPRFFSSHHHSPTERVWGEAHIKRDLSPSSEGGRSCSPTNYLIGARSRAEQKFTSPPEN